MFVASFAYEIIPTYALGFFPGELQILDWYASAKQLNAKHHPLLVS